MDTITTDLHYLELMELRGRVGANLGEATLIRAGAAFQGVTSWHRRHPPL